MKINETIGDLAKTGNVKRITFSFTDKNQPIITCEQVLRTMAGSSTCVHQSVGGDFEEAMKEIQKNVAQCAPIQSILSKIQRG